jgi:hypothetical protein
MDPVTLGLISMGVGGAIKVGADLFDNTAGKQADLMHQQAALKLSGLEENMRRTEGQQTQVLSSTKARMAGSGFATDSGSFTNYISTMATQFDLQNKATKEGGMKSIDLMNQAADIMDDPMKKIFGTAADIFGTAGAILGTMKPGAPAAPGPV